VTVLVRADGTVDFRVYDCETDEEYMPAHVFHSTGSFVSEIHKACESVLKDIADKCCDAEYFKWDQAKRILAFIKETYNAEPAFLWSRLPECAALRVPGKKPWFAVVGRMPKEKIGFADGGVAEVINLKDEPDEVMKKVREKKTPSRIPHEQTALVYRSSGRKPG
jgi:hypothetical protein